MRRGGCRRLSFSRSGTGTCGPPAARDFDQIPDAVSTVLHGTVAEKKIVHMFEKEFKKRCQAHLGARYGCNVAPAADQHEDG